MMNFIKYLWKVANYRIYMNLGYLYEFTLSYTIDISRKENFFHFLFT